MSGDRAAGPIGPIDLEDRLLWPDGDVTVDPDKIVDYIFKRAGRPPGRVCVSVMTEEIKSFNAVSDVPITVKTGVDASLFPPEWSFPDRYKYLDLNEYLIELSDGIERDGLYDERVSRLAQEIWVFRENGLDDVIRCMIYVVETMREKNAVWGVGRGSSCSSYLLFLMGLHSVDPVKYDIPLTDFIRPQGN